MTSTFREIVPYYKRNLKVAFPVMLTQLGAVLVGLADSMMVGRYGTADLAAVSFSNAIFFTVMVFAMGAKGAGIATLRSVSPSPPPTAAIPGYARSLKRCNKTYQCSIGEKYI